MFFEYTLRNLIARRATVIPTLVAVILAVVASTVVLGMFEGLFRTLSETGSPSNVIVLTRGVVGEDVGQIPIEAINELKAVPGLASEGADPLVSAEMVASVIFERANGTQEMLTVRGVDPIAFRIRTRAKLVSGRFPGSGEPGFIVGRRSIDVNEGRNEGGKIKLLREEWPVTGVLSAPGTKYESELWCSRQAFMRLMRADRVTSLVATLQSPDAVAAVTKTMEKRFPDLQVLSERAYYALGTQKLGAYKTAAQSLILFLALGAIIACANTMNASFLARRAELGTLRALGFRRTTISIIVFYECMALVLIGAFVGLLIALSMNGRPMEMKQLQLVYDVLISGRVMLAGLGIALAIGLLGSIVSVINALRLDAADVLRGA